MVKFCSVPVSMMVASSMAMVAVPAVVSKVLGMTTVAEVAVTPALGVMFVAVPASVKTTTALVVGKLVPVRTVVTLLDCPASAVFTLSELMAGGGVTVKLTLPLHNELVSQTVTW